MTESIHSVAILMAPTPGDARFYERWAEIAEITHDPARATILVVDFTRTVNEELIRTMPRLQIVATPCTGLTHIQCELEPKIRLISLKGEIEFLKGVKSVSEFVMRMILTVSRPIDGEFGHLLSGKTIGIVGLGRIGRQVSVLASAFGMHTYAVDKDSPDWAWDLLFKKSDFVSIHLPEEPDTYQLIGKDLLSLMKPTSYLVNTARASVLDEVALAQLLVEKKVAGACLDLTDASWVGFNNVLQAPHIGGHTVEDRIRTDEFLMEKVRQCLGPRRVKEARH